MPDSPSSSTVACDGAACMTISIVRRQASDCPMSARRCSAASWARSERFSCTSERFSIAFPTTRTRCARLIGLVTKS